MLPVLFHVGRFPVPTHDFFTLLGVLAAAVVFFLEARRRGVLEEKLLYVVLGSLLLGAFAAKVSTVWRYIDAAPHPTLDGVLLQGGKSVVGGLAGAYAGAIATKRIVGYRSSTGDLFAPAVVLGIAIGRVGCFLTEQLGTPTSMPWGIRLSPELAARVPNCPQCRLGVPLHPSFLYEIAFLLGMLAFLRWMRPRVRVPGELFKVFLLGYAAFRFLVELVRGNPPMWAGLSGTQLFLIPSTLLLVLYFAHRLARGASVDPEPALEAG